MEPQVEDTIIAKRSSSSKNFFHSLKIINFRCQFEIIQPKMSPCEQSELQSIPAGSLNKCTEALNNAISWQGEPTFTNSFTRWGLFYLFANYVSTSQTRNGRAWTFDRPLVIVRIKPSRKPMPCVSWALLMYETLESTSVNWYLSIVGDKLNPKEWMKQNVHMPQVQLPQVQLPQVQLPQVKFEYLSTYPMKRKF